MNEICDEDLLSTAEQSTKRGCQVQRLKIQPTLKQPYLEDELRREINFSEIAGKSAALRQVMWQVETVAPTDSTVLILGETGTGKELIARAIHQRSRRKDKPLIRVNCACIPKELYESEFFGHVRGAFTSAIRDRIGRLETASNGTLFLDEIGEIPVELQSKLLRILEEKCYERLGEDRTRHADVRIVAATNRDLKKEAAAGRFREDLYYRIHVVPIFLPPLRERPGDIPLLADYFVRFYCAANKLPLKRLEPEVIEILEEYEWPGNVRELENLMQRLVLMGEGSSIKEKHLPQQILYQTTASQESLLIPEAGIDFDEEMARTEVAYLRAALRRTEGRKSAAAQLLHLDPQRMKYLCRKYRIALD